MKFCLSMMLSLGVISGAYAQPANPARPSSPAVAPPQVVAPAPGTPPSAATTATSPAAANEAARNASVGVAGEYRSEVDAKRACGTDPVVWANLQSKVLHPTGDKWYGKTNRGSYMCRSVAVKNGMHMAKNASTQ